VLICADAVVRVPVESNPVLIESAIAVIVWMLLAVTASVVMVLTDVLAAKKGPVGTMVLAKMVLP
jgi:hypothetical protein